MTHNLSQHDPDDLDRQEILDKVAAIVYHSGGYTNTCEHFLQTINYTHLATSTRVVFESEEYVIKFACDEEGVVCNEAEYDVTNRLKETSLDVIAPTVEKQHYGYRWIKAKKANTKTPVTEDHYDKILSKLEILNQSADLIDQNIGILNERPVLVDYPELAEYDLSKRLS